MSSTHGVWSWGLSDGNVGSAVRIHGAPGCATVLFATLSHSLTGLMCHASGFEVTRHAYGLDTAWEATFEHGTGGPVVGFNSEMVRDSVTNICILI